ncbi:hypothetical protein MKW92_008059 [Papaver armeniacum]|nr:hypothetical protein MKW92_008059 [Papaver armeniacum]
MDCSTRIFIILIISIQISHILSQSVIQSPLEKNRIIDRKTLIRDITDDDEIFCDSWKFTVETNDAGIWSRIPKRCVKFVGDYMLGIRYASDSDRVLDSSLSFARNVKIAGDGKDAWVFDIDETLLSNVPYYQLHGFGSGLFDEKSFDEWVDLAEAPALPASLKLFYELKHLGFKIILLTGRSEFQRSATEKNLLFAGYDDWEKLLLRFVVLYCINNSWHTKNQYFNMDDTDIGKNATLYKLKRRQLAEEEGYRIHGNSGDQWSDLLGFASGKKINQTPSPMYYIA